MYEKSRNDEMFKHHFIRNSLMQVWLKYKKKLLNKRPLWIVPEEVIHFIVKTKDEDRVTYQDLIQFENDEAILKSEVETKYNFNCWTYLLRKNLFNRDKINFGFREHKTDLEIILLEENIKTISKLYKLLLKWYAAD